MEIKRTVNNFDFLQALLFDLIFNKETVHLKNDFFAFDFQNVLNTKECLLLIFLIDEVSLFIH